MKEYPKHEKDLIRKYEEDGYNHDFRHDSGELLDFETDKAYGPNDITEIAEHRYEGMSNPSDLSILYAMTMNDDIKGTFLMAYGPKADVDTVEFFKKIPEDRFIDR